MKKFIIILLSCFAGVLNLSANSVFSDTFQDVFLEDYPSTFELFSGRWVGSQELFVNDKAVAKASVVQSCREIKGYKTSRCLFIETEFTSNKSSLKLRSYIYLLDDMFIMELFDIDDSLSLYKGVLVGNKVVWTPLYSFILLDMFEYAFVYAEKGYAMFLNGRRYVEIPSMDFKGLMYSYARYEKTSNVFDADKVKSMGTEFFDSPSEKKSDDKSSK